MEKYHIFLSLSEGGVRKLTFSEFSNNLDKLLAWLEKLLALYKSGEKGKQI